MCLDIAGVNRRRGARVHMWHCHGGANQRWYFDGRGRLRSRLNHMCLDIAGGNRGRNAALHMWPCHGGANQRWRWSVRGAVRRPSTRFRYVKSRLNNFCVTARGNSRRNGTPVVNEACHNWAGQRFVLTRSGHLKDRLNGALHFFGGAVHVHVAGLVTVAHVAVIHETIVCHPAWC